MKYSSVSTKETSSRLNKQIRMMNIVVRIAINETAIVNE